MKKLFALFGLLMFAVTLNAQKPLSFETKKWDDVMKQAQTEKKGIFVEVASPGQIKAEMIASLNSEVYSDPEVSRLLSENFICTRVDMSSEDGKAFMPLLSGTMYPCFMFVYANGDKLASSSPYSALKDKPAFIATIKKAMDKASLKRNSTRKINFLDISFEDAKKMSEKEHKPIFIDAFFVGCHWCTEMAKDAFCLDDVADFYNTNFICLQIDFVKNPEMAKTYKPKGYPAYYYLDAKGEVIYENGGYTSGDNFIGYGKTAIAKKPGIKFTNGTWTEILKSAKAQNKLIFMDCYTSWCGPCKMLAKDIFTQKAVGELYNDKFINVQVDMEKGEGPALKDKFGVTAFPTLLFIDANENVIHRGLGSMLAEEFIALGKTALSDDNIDAMNKKFDNGIRDTSFIKTYLKVLESVDSKSRIQLVISTYFKNIKDNQLIEPLNWFFINKYVTDVNSREFQYLLKNKASFSQRYPEKEIATKIQQTFSRGALAFSKKEGTQYVIDQKGFEDYKKTLKKNKVETADQIILYAESDFALKTENFEAYAKIVNKGLETKLFSDNQMSLYNYALRCTKCTNPVVIKEAIKWLDMALSLPDSQNMWVKPLNKIKEEFQQKIK